MIKVKFCENRASMLWSQYTLCLIKLEGFKIRILDKPAKL